MTEALKQMPHASSEEHPQEEGWQNYQEVSTHWTRLRGDWRPPCCSMNSAWRSGLTREEPTLPSPEFRGDAERTWLNWLRWQRTSNCYWGALAWPVSCSRFPTPLFFLPDCWSVCRAASPPLRSPWRSGPGKEPKARVWGPRGTIHTPPQDRRRHL